MLCMTLEVTGTKELPLLPLWPCCVSYCSNTVDVGKKKKTPPGQTIETVVFYFGYDQNTSSRLI